MGKLLVVTGPSGVGKTYLAEQLIKLHPKLFASVQLYSTREPRPNERPTDRIFISRKEFANKQRRREFAFSGTFLGNQYGYTFASLKPHSKHLIVNAWPALIPELSLLPNIVLLGLTVDEESLPLLQQRMIQRGNTLAHVRERTSIIQRDIQELERIRHLIEDKGNVFTIKDDSTMSGLVIPWVETTLQGTSS